MDAYWTYSNLIPNSILNHCLRSDRVDVTVKKSLIDGAELSCHFSVRVNAGTVLVVLTTEDNANDRGHKGASSVEQPHDHEVFLDVTLQ